jgi:hypothetical protein
LIPPTRGGRIELLPLEGGGPGGGEKRCGRLIAFCWVIVPKFYSDTITNIENSKIVVPFNFSYLLLE